MPVAPLNFDKHVTINQIKICTVGPNYFLSLVTYAKDLQGAREPIFIRTPQDFAALWATASMGDTVIDSSWPC